MENRKSLKPGASKSRPAPAAALLDDVRLDPASDVPLYAQLVSGLRGLVAAHFGDGDLFYSEKTLVTHLPVSQITIRRAVRELAVEGLLAPGRGRGTLVQRRRTLETPPDHLARAGIRPARTLGIFLSESQRISSEHVMSLMQEFIRQGRNRSIVVRFHDTSEITHLSQVFRAIAGRQAEESFVLHTSSDTTLLLFHALDNRGCRSVAMEGFPPDYPGRTVATDAGEAVRIGMAHLMELGHRRIVLLVNEPASEFNVHDKMEAFQGYVAGHGLGETCRIVVCDSALGDDSYEAAFRHMDEVMGRDEVMAGASRPTAIFTVSDPGAWAALKWCGQNNVRVPDDVSVLGFENARSSKYMQPALSSVAHPDTQLVEAAYDVLWGAGKACPQHLAVRPVLVVRDSTGPVPVSSNSSS